MTDLDSDMKGSYEDNDAPMDTDCDNPVDRSSAFPHSSQNAHARPTVALVTIQRPISLVVSTMGSIPTFLVELPHLLPIANDLEHRIALLLSTLPRTTKDLYDVTARYLNPSDLVQGHILHVCSPPTTIYFLQ